MLVALRLLSTLALAGPPLVQTLDDGLTVILDEDHGADHIAVRLSVRVGSRDERPSEHGQAHLFEHLMLGDSTNLPSGQLRALLAGVGGRASATTSPDETVYELVVPASALDPALFVISDRLGFLDLRLEEEAVAIQRAILAQERAERSDQPPGEDLLRQLQHPPGHPYHHPMSGDAATVEAGTLRDLLPFWQRHYRPRNATLVLVGPFHTAEALARVQDWFSDVVDTGPPPPRPEAAAPHTSAELEREAAVASPTVLLSWPTVPHGHDDEPALDVLTEWLHASEAAGRGTVLHATATHHELCGHFTARLSSTSASAPQLQRAAEGLVRRLTHREASADEVSAAVDRKVQTLRAAWETPETRAGALLDCYRVYGRPDCLEEHVARHLAVSPAELRRVAAARLQPEFRVRVTLLPDAPAEQAR